jgi:tetratricopeptide (TPR) repeat protein
MGTPGWKCRKCQSFNQPDETKCNNCGAKKPSFFATPLFFIIAGGGILLIVVVVIVINMMGMPARKYREAFENAYRDKQITEDEKLHLSKIQKQWNISDEKAKALQDEVRMVQKPQGKMESKPGPLEPTPPSKQGDNIPMEAKLNLQQGMNYVKSRDYENAIKEFSLAIEKYPNYAVAYSNRGVAYMQQKKFNKAMDDLLKASEIDPSNKDIHYNFTSLYSLQNQLDRALDSLDKALSLGFNDYDALRNDPDLANLRKHPEFRKILEKHKVFIK